MRLANLGQLLGCLHHLEFQELQDIGAIDTMVTGLKSSYPQEAGERVSGNRGPGGVEL
jgi:hypothetical protein